MQGKYQNHPNIDSIDLRLQILGIVLYVEDSKSLVRLIELDQATSMRDKLQFARAMIEVHIDHNFPDELEFFSDKEILNVRC